VPRGIKSSPKSGDCRLDGPAILKRCRDFPGESSIVATWGDGLFAVTGDGSTQEIANQPVRGLARMDAAVHSPLLAGIRCAGVHRARMANRRLRASSSFRVVWLFGDTIYAGTDDARMLCLSHEGGVLDPIDGFDNVAGRDAWFAGSAIVNGQRLGPPLGIRSVAANSNGSVLYANVHMGGIPRSMECGRTWQPTIDINSDVHEVCAHPADPDIVAAASAIGLCISRDAGATWTIEKEGLHAPHCSAVRVLRRRHPCLRIDGSPLRPREEFIVGRSDRMET